jgi:hypothetical protein
MPGVPEGASSEPFHHSEERRFGCSTASKGCGAVTGRDAPDLTASSPVSEWEPECHPLALAVAPGDPGRELEERRLPAVV